MYKGSIGRQKVAQQLFRQVAVLLNSHLGLNEPCSKSVHSSPAIINAHGTLCIANLKKWAAFTGQIKSQNNSGGKLGQINRLLGTFASD